MCLLIAQRKGHKIKKQHLYNGFFKNDDGAGYAYIDGHDKIQVRKFDTWEGFWTRYSSDWNECGKQSPFLVHFRFATHGTLGEDNTHPFHLSMTGEGESVFAHNGIIDIPTPKEDVKAGLSDSRVFGKYILNRLPDDWVDNTALNILVEEYLGKHNKIALLTTSPLVKQQLYIFNEFMGTWYGGVWFSNDGFKTKPQTWTMLPAKHATGKWWGYGWDSDNYNDYYWKGDTLANRRKDGEDDDELSMALASDQGYCVACLYKPCACSDMCWECGGNLDDAANPCYCCWTCCRTREECDCKHGLYADDYITERNGYKTLDRFKIYEPTPRREVTNETLSVA